MIIPTKDQVYERWDELPMILREALTSEANTAFVWKISEAEHIPDEKIYQVGRAVSHVLLGFIHAEDVAVELKLAGFNPQIVSSLTDSINKRIFAPLQQDIDKVYSPIEKLPGAGKVFHDIGPVPKPPVPSATPTPITPTPGVQPISINKVATSQQPGWSTVRPSLTPTRPLPPQVPSPTPSTLPKAPVQVQFTPVAPAPKTSEPAPFMLHEDVRPTSLQKSNDFRLSRPEETSSFSMAGGNTKLPVKPAVLELGKNPAPNPSIPSNTMPKAIHYTQIPATGPRNISEVTAAPAVPVKPLTPFVAPSAPKVPASVPTQTSIPKPPTPPTTPMVPKPPSPPVPGAAPKVIRQNY